MYNVIDVLTATTDNVSAQALSWLWITNKLDTSRIAEIVKKANLFGIRECVTPSLILLLPLFVVAIILSKKGLSAVVVSSIFKLTHPAPTTAADVRRT